MSTNNQRIAVFELARELHVRPLAIIQSAQRLKINVLRAAATLTAGQAERIRYDVKANGRPVGLVTAPAPALKAPVQRAATCECCRLHFMYSAYENQPRWCAHCVSHHPGADDDVDRQIARLTDHEARMREKCDAATKAANDYEQRMKDAYSSRQKWKRALVEIVVWHEQTEELSCACGAPRWPCMTLRLLEDSNRGIHRAVEALTGLSPEALERELNKHEPWRISRFEMARDDDPLFAEPVQDAHPESA